MVGLPARGKSYTGRKLARYLSWLGYQTKIFNLGDYRRWRLGAQQGHDFFDPGNPAGSKARSELAAAALDDMMAWFEGDGQVAIYDATNSTVERRALVKTRCVDLGVRVLFVETVSRDEALLEASIRDNKTRSPDYAGVDADEAVADFRARIAHYERSYEAVDDEEGSYVRMVDAGRQLMVNRLEGYISARVLLFLSNIHLTVKPIWITRHGESIYNISGQIGGDAHLSLRGERYAHALRAYLDERWPERDEPMVWTSSLKRTIETAASLERPWLPLRALDEIDAGICDGMTYDEIGRALPEEARARAEDKFHYRYPRGESYADVIKRLDPIILELERQRSPVLIIAHQAVLRALYAYFLGMPTEHCPYLSVPFHTVIELTPHAYGCSEERVALAPRVEDSPSS